MNTHILYKSIFSSRINDAYGIIRKFAQPNPNFCWLFNSKPSILPMISFPENLSALVFDCCPFG